MGGVGGPDIILAIMILDRYGVTMPPICNCGRQKWQEGQTLFGNLVR